MSKHKKVWHETSSASRGYGWAWQKLRQEVKRRDSGLCQECLRSGRVTPGSECDHIVGKAEATRRGWTQERMDALDNLQWLCKRCHEAKTIKENGGEPKPKRKIGLDGYPIGE